MTRKYKNITQKCTVHQHMIKCSKTYLWSCATCSQISIFFIQSISLSLSLVAAFTSSDAILMIPSARITTKLQQAENISYHLTESLRNKSVLLLLINSFHSNQLIINTLIQHPTRHCLNFSAMNNLSCTWGTVISYGTGA